MCLYPKLIRNKKYTATKKNGGRVPVVNDTRVLAVPIGCGKCMECVKKKAREWQVRLMEDIKHNKSGIFVTLTFSNEQLKHIVEGKDIEGKQITEPLTAKGYELDNQIASIATRRFTERWRKEHKKAIRHWLVTELGHEGTENIHLHGIIWTDKGIEEIIKHWQYGYVWPTNKHTINYVSEKTINYVTKYITKQDAQHKEYKAKIYSSKGIGRGYMERADAANNQYKEGKTKETYTTRNGRKIGLPIYLRNKIYTEEEREKLWIEKLDQKIRWINGQKIDISKGEEEYYNVLKYERKKAKRLGYQDNETDWTRKEYEEQRRMLNMEKRLNDEV